MREINSKHVSLPYYKDLNQHVFHLFVVRCKSRNELKEYFFKNNIETFVHYPTPIHKQKAYQEFNNQKFPITERIHNEVLSLPMNQLLENQEVKKIVDVLSNYK